MKKISLVLIIALALLLVGCLSIDEREYTVEKIVTGNDIVEISLIPYFIKSGLGDGTSSYSLLLKNTSDSIIKINWSKSSITYGEGIYLPLINGQNYKDANTPMPPSVVPPNGLVNIGFNSSEQAYFSPTFGWMEYPILYYDTTVTICIEYDEGETYYTFLVDA